MNSNFKDLLSTLDRFGVKYLVVGGYAVMVYCEPRYTKDLDIFIGVSDENIQAFRKALADFGFPMTDQAAQDLRKPDRMISIGHPPVRIDILNNITGLEFESVWVDRKIVDIEGTNMAVVSLPDLIKSKEASARPQDLIDLKSLHKELERQKEEEE